MAYNRPVFQPSTRNSCLHSYRTFSGRAAIFVALFALMLGVLAVTGPQTYAVAADTKVREVLTIESGGKTHTFHVEVARTPQEKTKGLMYRTKLPSGTGMLFPYDEPMEIQMWMRNTFIPLDMVFIRADGRIHRIEALTEPMSEKLIGSHGDTTGVLEIGGGEAARLGIKAGDLVRHAHFGTAGAR